MNSHTNNDEIRTDLDRLADDGCRHTDDTNTDD